MAEKGKITVDSEEEIRQIEKELEEEARYAVASAKGIVPADAVIKIERKKGRPSGGLSAISKAAGGKKSRIKRGRAYKPTDDDVKSWLDMADENDDGQIDIEEYEHIVNPKKKK